MKVRLSPNSALAQIRTISINNQKENMMSSFNKAELKESYHSGGGGTGTQDFKKNLYGSHYWKR